MSKAGGSRRVYENWQEVEGEGLCRCLSATGESTPGEAGGCRASLSAAVIERGALQGWIFTDFTVLGASQHPAPSEAAEVTLPSREFRSPGSDVPVRSVTRSCWPSGTNWCPVAVSGAGKVLLLTPFLFLLGCFFFFFLAFFSLAG